MNRKIVQKIIDALNIGTPDKVMYAIGALDMILETLPNEMETKVDKALEKIFTPTPPTELGEADILDREAKARLANIKVTYDN